MQMKLLIVILTYFLFTIPFHSISSNRKRFVLKFRENYSLKEKQEVESLLGLLRAKKVKSKGYSRVGDIFYLSSSSPHIIKEIKSLAQVEYFDEDRTIPLDDIPGDPNIQDQWHHKNINTFSSWSKTKGEGIMVGVCDTGVDAKHLDLNENLILPGYNVVDDNYDMTPVHPHGTSVSGVIAALANNSIGGSGISPEVKILPIKVSNESDGRAYYSDLAECIMYAVDKGAKVVNLSYGGAETEIINAAGKYARNNGALLVAAAGNTGMDISKWKDWDSFIMVGATDYRNEIAYFSNYGTPIDMVAPGLSIVTADMIEGENQAPYKSTSGTSFSAPMVSAAAALIYSINPSFTNDEVQEILYQSSDHSIGGEYEYGAGLLDVAKAVNIAVEKSQ